MSTHNICFRSEIRKISCGYPLLSVGMLEAPCQGVSYDFLSTQVPCQGASYEYPQQMFSWRNKKDIMWIPHLFWGYEEC